MAAKQPVMAGDGGGGFVSQAAGMSKTQLYDIMTQMKKLIEQNQQQARQILIENPPLTKSLFQAQIMLGMVRPPKVMPNIQQALSQQQQPSAQTSQKQNVPGPQAMQVDYGTQGEPSSSQMQLPTKQQFQPSASVPPLAFQSQAMPSSSLPSLQQTQGPLSAQIPPNSLAPNTQIHNLPPPPPPDLQQPAFQSHAPIPSSQIHHSMQPSGSVHQPLQPPLPALPRPMQQFPHQLHSLVGHNLGFQPSSTAPQQQQQQQIFQPGTGLASSFSQGQQPIPLQPPQQLYQGGTAQIRADYSNQNVRPMSVDRVPQWAAGPPDSSMPGAQLPGPPTLPSMLPSQAIQPPNAQLTPELEKNLLQQLMSLTPEQINLLPPEQRQQVFHLQQLFR